MDEIISYGRFHCRELALHKNLGMEITYIDKGSLEWMVEGKIEKVESGSIFFTLPWQVHGSVNLKEPQNTIWHVLFQLKHNYPSQRPHFKFPAALGFTPDEMATLSQTFCNSSQHCFKASSAMRSLMPALIEELQSTRELRKTHTITLLRAIIVELKRIITNELPNKTTHTLSERKVKELIAELSSSCDQTWTLKQMEDYCGIRRTQLTKIFEKLTGSTPMEYLFRIRIERAKNLLRETNYSIIDIAYECGYGTSQYFANNFKKATGLTPSTYRKRVSALSAAESKNFKNIQFRSIKEEKTRVIKFSKKA